MAHKIMIQNPRVQIVIFGFVLALNLANSTEFYVLHPGHYDCKDTENMR